MSKITILHYSLGGTGGLSNISSTLANHWTKQGHVVSRVGICKPLVKSPYAMEKEVKEFSLLNTTEVNTNKISLSPKFLWTIGSTIFPLSISKRKKLNSFLDKQDIILVQNPLITRWLSKRNKKKCTLFIHQQYGALMEKILKFNKASIKSKISNIISLDPVTKDILDDLLKPDNSIWVPNFLTKDVNPLNPKRKDIIFLGRIAFGKNIPWIIELAETYPDEKFILYGGIEPNYKKTWESLEKPSNFIYKGLTNNPMQALADARISLHTGIIEGYSLSMVEAACSGNILLSAPSWDSKDPNLTEIMFRGETKEEFIAKFKDANEADLPDELIVNKLKEYYSFENYLKRIEKIVF